MMVYVFFEGDLIGLGSYLGSFSNLDAGLQAARSYFQCIHFQLADHFADARNIEAALVDQASQSVWVTTDNDNGLYIFRSALDQPVPDI